MNFGKSLKVLMARRGMAVCDAAAITGRTYTRVVAWRGKKVVSGRTLEHVCKSFGIEESEFLKLGEDG